jgi:hypothetical protein
MTHDQAGLDADAPAVMTTTEPVTEEQRATGDTTRGVRALVGVAVAIVGVLAAAKPESAVLKALSQTMPQVADAVPALITTCGAVLAAFSPPPKLVRRRG